MKIKNVGLRFGTQNVRVCWYHGERLVDILCVQETRRKDSRTNAIGGGYKLYHPAQMSGEIEWRQFQRKCKKCVGG